MKTRLGSILASIVGVVFLSLFVLERVELASVQETLRSPIPDSTVFEHQASSSEIIYLDTFDPGDHGAAGPVSSSSILSSGVRYLVTISGTFSVWSDSMWYSVCKGVPENWPQIPSPGITNGKVGVDPAFVFAIPEDDVATCLMDTPYEHSRLEISLDNGVSWFALVPINPIYNTSHIYTYLVEGQGFRTQLRYSDHPTSDNYGVLTIHIEDAPCAVPFFSQVDEKWEEHPLRTDPNSKYKCSAYCSTIGHCGCNLTSAAMVFNTYGAYTNPAQLSDCMGTSACPYAWLAGASCSQNNARWISRPDFNWDVLNQQVNQHHHPVILGMHRKGNPDDTHLVVVVSGKGNDPENYRIHDPAFKCGANISLSTRSQDYDFDYLGIYASQVPCSSLITLTPPCVSRGANPQPVVTSTMNLNMPLHNISAASPSIISGTVWLYTMTELTMTVEITATSSVGTIEEMLIWSDSMSNTTWQPFTPFVWLPVSEFVYAQFKDNLGNVTGIYSDTLYPSGPPTGPVPLQVFLPLVIRQ